MANIFREAWNVITSRWRGGGTSKKEAETIMKNIGVLEEDDDLEEDYVFAALFYCRIRNLFYSEF